MKQCTVSYIIVLSDKVPYRILTESGLQKAFNSVKIRSLKIISDQKFSIMTSACFVHAFI